MTTPLEPSLTRYVESIINMATEDFPLSSNDKDALAQQILMECNTTHSLFKRIRLEAVLYHLCDYHLSLQPSGLYQLAPALSH